MTVVTVEKINVFVKFSKYFGNASVKKVHILDIISRNCSNIFKSKIAKSLTHLRFIIDNTQKPKLYDSCSIAFCY